MHQVLLVDDEVFVRQGLIELIDWPGCGFEIMDEAGNGEDALEIIRLKKPDLVITDIRMPVLDGLELIRRASQEQLHTMFIIVSGYNEFEYAQQAVRFGVHDFILKPIDENVLQQTLIGLNEKLRKEQSLSRQNERLRSNEIIASLIKGEYNKEQISEWQGRLGIPAESPLFYMFVEVNDIHPWNGQLSELTSEELASEIRNALTDIAPAAANAHIHEHRGRLGLAIATEQLPSGCNGEQFASALQRRLSAATGQVIIIYIGSVVKSLSEMREAYQRAKDTLPYKYTGEEQTIFVYDRVRSLALNYVVLDSSFHERLYECMEESNVPVIHQTIDRIFEEFRTAHYAPEAVKASIHRCVSGILRALKDMEIEKDALNSLKPMIIWQDSNITLRELKRLFTQFVLECSELMVEQRKDIWKGGIQKVKAYIEANYAGSISLKSIAARFYMNPVYLGQLFKKKYGIYFNDYLLQLRIQEAKRLIRQTDLRIYEIAEKVGFNHVEYFVTQFEKMEKMTPTEYRNRLR
ncbi:response regulator [Paenibacillus sp. sgz302251]|uniref:response regulator n=1 Tax=Paenibacillus sp. sgz302251 TaxID=3414493 RepID=UPI003C79B648